MTPRTHSGRRLRVEHLEDRSVPAFFVNTTLDDVIPGNGRQSLREAITRANNHPGADVIVLPAGLFKITIAGADEDGNLSGDFDITDRVTIQGAGAGRTFLDGQQFDRVFDIHGIAPSLIRVVLQGLTVRNGLVIGDGGGIRVGNADLVIRDCVVSGNRALLTGGGISNGAAIGTGNVAIIRSTVVRNSSDSNGGGINVTGSSTLTLRDSTVRRNIAAADGGGIAAANTANVTNSTISGNSAGTFGGGIATNTATLSNSTVSGNSAKTQGGGISAGTANVTNSTVSGNNAGGSGGGVFADTANVTNSTVSGNNAKTVGGGILANTANVTNSTVSGNSATTFGGGIRATTANVTNSSVSGNNSKNFGGGIDAITATVTNSTVSGNSAVTGGGGVFATTANVIGSTVSGNNAKTEGGGIHALTATVTNSTVSGNNAETEGGGIFAETATVTNSTVSGNTAGAEGGGGVFAVTANVIGSTVSGNNAGIRGGGIRAVTANVTNSNVSGNNAETEGGGVWAIGGMLTNCTITENYAHIGGGVFHPTTAPGNITVRNTIIAQNLVDFSGNGPDAFGNFRSLGRNLIGIRDGSTGFITELTFNIPLDLTGTAASPLDPKLGPLANNGGRTLTHALLAGSPAIDQGNNEGVPATDQRGTGFQRVKDGNGDRRAIVDIGAFER